MASQSRVQAAQLIRRAVAGEMSEEQFEAEWLPEFDDPDLCRSRRNVGVFYRVRRSGTAREVSLLTQDLSELADRLESGQEIPWDEPQSGWAATAGRIALAIGVMLGLAVWAFTHDWFVAVMLVPVPVACVWVAEWFFSR